jgi:hypothetical protein
METTNKPEERQIVCSGCLKIFPESIVHVIPYFNDSIGSYVTTYRCARCWLAALKETQMRLVRTEDENEIASVGNFFVKHGVILLEFQRGDPTPVVRKLLIQMIDKLRSGDIQLSIGPAVD